MKIELAKIDNQIFLSLFNGFYEEQKVEGLNLNDLDALKWCQLINSFNLAILNLNDVSKEKPKLIVNGKEFEIEFIDLTSSFYPTLINKKNSLNFQILITFKHPKNEKDISLSISNTNTHYGLKTEFELYYTGTNFDVYKFLEEQEFVEL